jgi:hypothetical protein
MSASILCFPDLTGFGGGIANLRVQKRDVVDDRSRESGLQLPRIGFGIDVADSGQTIRLRRSVRGYLAAGTCTGIRPATCRKSRHRPGQMLHSGLSTPLLQWQ